MSELLSPRTYTIDEAAQLLGIGRNSAYEAARRGEIPTVKIGKRLLVPKASFDRLLAGDAA
jgi:excisionase family DNA binding protein